MHGQHTGKATTQLIGTGGSSPFHLYFPDLARYPTRIECRAPPGPPAPHPHPPGPASSPLTAFAARGSSPRAAGTRTASRQLATLRRVLATATGRRSDWGEEGRRVGVQLKAAV